MPPKRKIEDKKESDQKKTKESEVKPKLKDFVPKIKNNYPQLYKGVKNYEDKRKLFSDIIDEENGYRELFAQIRDSPIISDNHLMLIDAFKNQDIFKNVKLSNEDEKLPKIFPSTNTLVNENDSCIVDKKEFERNFVVFCEDQFKYMNWDNVLAAGGSVLASLTPVPEEHRTNAKTKRKYYHDIAYAGSDIDLFIYGLETEEECNKKLIEIYEAVTDANPKLCVAFRSKHVVTLVSEYPYRHIQIVLRQYKTAAEILMCFDVDSCSVGYDGKSVYMTPRAHRALTHRYNVVDMERRSPSYEMRLAKYAERGYSVVVPSLDREKVDPQLFEKRFDQLQGLARLLLLEKLKSPESRYRYKEQLRLKKLRPEPKEGRTSFVNKFGLDADDLGDEREKGTSSASDYSTVYLPWGIKWNAEKIRKLCYTKDVILNSEWYSKNKKHHTHPCFFGTAQDVIKDCCGACPPIPEEEIDPDTPYISGKMTWVTVNPGAQGKVGSFNPITEGDWTHGAYISSSTQKYIMAVNKNDVETVKYCLEKEGTDIESRDAVGRTALHVAALSGSFEVAKFLLEYGARVSGKTIDGRTALHLAASYGHHRIVKLLLKRGKQIEEENKKAEEKKKLEEENKKKKGGKKGKKKSKKDDMDDDEGEGEDEEDEGDEDDEGEGEGEGEDDEGDGDDDFEGIASIIEKKKKEALEELEKFDPLAQENKPDQLEVDLKDWDMDMNALHYAIYFGWPKVISALVKGGCTLTGTYDLGDNSISLLQLAILGGSIQTIQTLLKLGVDVNQKSSYNETGLHHACRIGNFEIIKLIVENGKADLNILSNQGSALSVLISNNIHRKFNGEEEEQNNNNVFGFGYNNYNQSNIIKDPLADELFEMIRYLVSKGAKVHHENNFSHYPLIIAAQQKSLKLIEFLLDSGAQINHYQSGNQTILDIIINVQENIQYQIASLEDNNMIYKITKQMKEYKEDSLEWFILNEYKDQHLGEKTLEEWIESKKAKIEELKASKQYMKKIRDYLNKKDAKRYRHFHPSSWYGRNTYNSSNSRIEFNYGPIEETFYYYNRNYDKIQLSEYHKLFKAIWEGNIEEVERLTIKQPIGKQLHVCSKSSLFGWSTLFIAITKKNTKMLKRLMEICVEQYTPPIVEEEEDDTPAINNYELVSLMKNVGTRSLRRGAERQKKRKNLENAKKNPNSNCLTSLYSFLSYKDHQTQFNILHCCAYSRSNDCLDVVLDYIKDEKMKRKKEDGKEENLKELLVDRGYKQFTPFELSIARGNIEGARKILKAGGIDIPELAEKNEYKGLDVGGKKMEWAFEHMDRRVRYDRTAFHLSAAYGRVECIEFLKEEAVTLWNKLSMSSKVKDFNYFDPFATDSSGKTPLHWAIYNNNPKVIQPFLKIDNARMLNAPDTNGLTPLHIAASSPKYTESLKILLDSGADIDIREKLSGYNALHIACCISKNEENVKLLLNKCNNKQANAITEKLHQTPVMISAYYGNEPVLKILLESKKCDLSLRDICGDYAIHHAIKKTQINCVKIILEEMKKQGGDVLSTIYNEDGMGLNPLDFSMYKMINKLAQTRHSYSSVQLNSQLSGVYNYISTNAKTKRVLTTFDYTRETTTTILNGVESNNFEDFFGLPGISCPRFDKFVDEQKPSKEDQIELNEEDMKFDD